MPNVQIPGVGVVAFPDGMSDQDVSAAAKRLYQSALVGPPAPAKRPYSGTADLPLQNPPWWGDPVEYGAAMLGGPAAREAGYAADYMAEAAPRLGRAAVRGAQDVGGRIGAMLQNVPWPVVKYLLRHVPGSAEAELAHGLLRPMIQRAGAAAAGEAGAAAAPAAEAVSPPWALAGETLPTGDMVPEGFTWRKGHLVKLAKGAKSRLGSAPEAAPEPDAGPSAEDLKYRPWLGRTPQPNYPLPQRAALGNVGGSDLQGLLQQSLGHAQAMGNAGMDPFQQELLWQVLRGQQ